MKQKNSGLRDLLNTSPYPIASIIGKYLRLSDDKYLERHSVLGDLFEVIVKFVGIVLVKEAHVSDKKIKNRFPGGLDFLKHPSLGHWASIIREFGKDNYDNPDLWVSKIANWYKGDKPGSEILSCYLHIPEIDFPKGNSDIEGIINSFVTYRNKVWKGHGAVNNDVDDLKTRLPAIETLLCYCLSKAEFLNNMNLIFTQEVKKIDKINMQANCISLNGIELSSSSHVYSDFEPQEIYLAYSDEKHLQLKPVMISPLIEWQQNANNQYQIYFFNDAKRAKLEYLSYLDASYYYYKEVKRELEKIFNVTLKQSDADFDHKIYQYSEEERKEQSEYFFKKGLEFQNKNNWEAAIVAFEDALEWHRQPKIIVEICKAMHELGEDQNYVLNTLEGAFELSPYYEPAILLKSKIETGQEEISEIRRSPLTYFEFLIPNKLRQFAIPIYSILLSVVFSSSAMIIAFIDRENQTQHIVSTSILLMQSLIIVIGLSSIRNKFIDSFFPLLGQQASMRTERFKFWFDQKLTLMLGDFIPQRAAGNKESGKISSLLDYRDKINYSNEKYFIWLASAIIVSFTVSAISVQGLHQDPLFVGVIRLLNTSIIWAFLIPMARFIIVSTLTIKEYGTLDLKPVVSTTNINGFRVLNRIFTYTLMLFILFWINLIAWHYFVVKGPLIIDFFGIGVGFAISLFWILYTPLYMRRAIKIAKNVVINDYDNHIHNAFNKFLKNPEKNNLDGLSWLLGNEKIVKQISTRVFGLRDWLIYILSIIIFLSTSIAYVMFRLGLLDI